MTLIKSSNNEVIQTTEVTTNGKQLIARTLSVAIVGRPNVGKSTLLNKLIGQKISIVTPKVQTTRTVITGIVTRANVQLVLLDTPGIFTPKRRLERAMVRCAWSSLTGADMVALILDSVKPLDQESVDIIEKLFELKLRVIFLLNKCDQHNKIAAKDDCYKKNIRLLSEKWPAVAQFKISALTGEGIDRLEMYLCRAAREAPWCYDEEYATTLPMRFLAAEITREQLFLCLDQELPYRLTVEHETWKLHDDGSIRIGQVITVSKQSHKSIILGKDGSMIKQIGIKARQNISEMLDTKVHLMLFVKVREDWDENQASYTNMMLEYQG